MPPEDAAPPPSGCVYIPPLPLPSWLNLPTQDTHILRSTGRIQNPTLDASTDGVHPHALRGNFEMDAQARTTPAGGRSERRKPKSGMRSAGTQFGQLGLRSGLPHAPASFSSVSGSNTSTHFMSARCTAGAWMGPPAGGSNDEHCKSTLNYV